MDKQLNRTNHALLMGDRDGVQVKSGDGQGISATNWLRALACQDLAKELR